MEEAKKPDNRQQAKEKKLKIALSITAILLVLAIAWLLIFKNSGAWLLDKGEWSNASYTLGYIDYTYEVNNQQVDISGKQGDIQLAATVPLIGGVKLNDQATVTGKSNYEPYAEENFNEGITVAHIKIVNKSTFAVNMTYELSFENMFDSASPQDLFYLILPQGAVVDTEKKTVQAGGEIKTYKDYITHILNSASTYDGMITELKNYYENGAGAVLKKGEKKLNLPKPGETEQKDTALEFTILFWSEYNDKLPFVETVNGKEQLMPPSDPAVSNLEGQFTIKISCSQQEEALRAAQ